MQTVTIDLIPQKEKPIVKLSQYDNDRQVRFMLEENGEIYTLAGTETVEVNIRKPDRNIVVIAPTIGANAYVDVLFTEQSAACFGESFGELSIKSGDTVIGTCNFIIDVEISPIYGGIDSATEINNLETQIEEIITEVLSDDYYTKTETDDLLDAKADASDVYTKTQTDSLLSAKADASDVYTKTQTDTLLSAKADASDVYTKTQTDTLLDAKANASDVYTKNQVDGIILDIMPVDTSSGPIASFDTELAAPLVNVSCNVVATGGYDADTQTAHPINGYTEANITANGDTVTIAFGQTVYGGVLDVTRGKLTDTFDDSNLSDITGWSYGNGFFRTFALKDIIKKPTSQTVATNAFCSIYKSVSWNACGDNDFEFAFNAVNGELIIKDSRYTDVPTFLAGVSGIPLAYELATPFDIDLTPEVISAVVGTNDVYSDTNGDTTVKFKDSIQHYIDNH